MDTNSTEAKTVIKIENLDFFYNRGTDIETHVLKGISLEIKQGEYASFLGASGCGKSTLLYVMSGIDKATVGKVLINDKDLIQFNQKQAAHFRQNGIGFIFQNFNLIPSLRIVDNVALPMTFMGVDPVTRRTRAMMLLKKLEIDHLASRYPFELSGGQQQRVGIARALANDPPIILADEPIGNLDTTAATTVLDILKEINQKDGKTVVIVTHEPWSLRDVTKNFKIRDGRIVETEIRDPSKVKYIDPNGEGAEGLEHEVSTDAQAKMLTELLFSIHSHEEISRAEEFIKLRLSNQISPDEFRHDLNKSFKDFGVGLWTSSARKISDQIESFLIEKQEILSLMDAKSESIKEQDAHKISKIRSWILDGVNTKLSPDKLRDVSSLIGVRARGTITKEEFFESLSGSKERGGVGLNVNTVRRICERMDILIDK